MNSNRITTALVVSLLIHTALLVSVVWWFLHNANLLGGGSGVVEVAVVGEGSNVVSLRGAGAPKQSHEIPPHPPLQRGDRGDLTDRGEGGMGGSGEGVGSGTGTGDSRLTTIWRKINRAKYYPEMARRDGVEGAPKVAFSILENGKVEGVKIVESSGNEILDRAAVEAIQNSAPLPFYPQPITIAVRYSLKDH